MSKSISTTTLYGVDFSGGKNAGQKIWITEAKVKGKKIEIARCASIMEMTGCSKDRTEALKALVTLISQSRSAVWAIDFPFSLPEKIVVGKTWEAFIKRFNREHVDEMLFRGRCRVASFGKELKRATDIETRTPFSPYNLRIYRQTYFGMGHLLAPLVRAKQAAIVPMMQAIDGQPIVIEICPASTLKKQKLYFSYKGKGAGLAASRERLLQELQLLYPVEVPFDIERKIIANQEGDALDSLIAVFAAYANMETLHAPSLTLNKLEGYVYI